MWQIDINSDFLDEEVLVEVFAFLTHFYWVLGSVIYSLKFISPSFNEATSYGKLLASKKGLILHSIAWPSFYIFGSIWNLLVIAFEIYLVRIYIIQLKYI